MWPAGCRKGIVFRKRASAGAVTTGYAADISCSESTLQGWDGLLLTIRHVYLPLVSARRTQAGAGAEGKKMLESYQRFLAAVDATEGQVRGQTILPLPPDMLLTSLRGSVGVARAGGTPQLQRKPSQKQFQGSRDRLHVLETSVIAWTKLIKTILKADVADILAQLAWVGGPLAEVDVQATHADNLAAVLVQLQSSSVRGILLELELMGSAYAPAFAAVEQEVAVAAQCAESNKVFAGTLRPYLQQLCNRTASPDAIIAIFPPLLATLLLVWQHSPHYHRPRRFIAVLRLICDETIAQAASRVTSQHSISADPDRLGEELRDALRLCAALRGT